MKLDLCSKKKKKKRKKREGDEKKRKRTRKTARSRWREGRVKEGVNTKTKGFDPMFYFQYALFVSFCVS